MIDNRAFIRDQLLAEKTLLKYTYGSDALDPWLTAMLADLIASRYDSILDIIAMPTTYRMVSTTCADSEAPETCVDTISDVQGIAFYNKKTGALVTGIGGADSIDPNTLSVNGNAPIIDVNLFASTQNSDYFANYLVQFDAKGNPYFLVKLIHKTKSHGFFGDLFAMIAPIAPIIGLGLNLLVPGVGSLIGEAVLGESGAFYPLLAESIGNIAVNTALNGGDIERAVQSAITGSISSGVGLSVSDTVDSVIAGRAASAATSAAVSGSDIKKAVFLSLANSGVSSVTKELSTMPSLNNASDYFSNDIPLDSSQSDYIDAGSISFDPVGAAAQQQAIVDAIPILTPADVFGSDGGAVANSSSFVDSRSTTDRIAEIVGTAGKMALAWRAAGTPRPLLPGSNSRSGLVTASNNGTIKTTDASGRSTNSIPAAGQPYVTPAGEIMTNNGDGSFSVVSLNGQVKTTAYSNAQMSSKSISAQISGFSLSSVPISAWIVGAFLAVKILK